MSDLIALIRESENVSTSPCKGWNKGLTIGGGDKLNICRKETCNRATQAGGVVFMATPFCFCWCLLVPKAESCNSRTYVFFTSTR